MISRIIVLAAEEETKNPLLPADYDILWSSVVFAIMLTFFWLRVLPSFKKVLNERTEAIEGRLAAAEKAQSEAAAKTDELSKAQENTRAEASAIREEARAEGAAILAELKEQAQAEAARITQTAKAQIEAERAQRAADRQEATQAWRDANSALVARLDAYTGANEFLRSAKQNIAQWGNLSARQVEAVESCFAVIDRQEFARANSQHIGAVGDKVTLTITVERIIVLHSEFYGNNYITIARDEAGNAITYKGKTSIGGKGDINTVKASIKEHTVYNGIKQTVIQRPKVLETV